MRPFFLFLRGMEDSLSFLFCVNHPGFYCPGGPPLWPGSKTEILFFSLSPNFATSVSRELSFFPNYKSPAFFLLEKRLLLCPAARSVERVRPWKELGPIRISLIFRKGVSPPFFSVAVFIPHFHSNFNLLGWILRVDLRPEVSLALQTRWAQPEPILPPGVPDQRRTIS